MFGNDVLHYNLSYWLSFSSVIKGKFMSYEEGFGRMIWREMFYDYGNRGKLGVFVQIFGIIFDDIFCV